jgi:methylated-DNA-protein-cysteine methyltransferase related protein
MSTEEYVEAVLDLVERIPPGRVMTYGAIAEALAEVAGRASPRQVGTIMARYGGSVPWYRVVGASGRLVPGHEQRARKLLAAEGTPMRGERVDLRAAGWFPPHPLDGSGPDAAADLGNHRPGRER